MVEDSLKDALSHSDYQSVRGYIRTWQSDGLDTAQIFEDRLLPVVTQFEIDYESNRLALSDLISILKAVRKLEEETGYAVPHLGKAVVASSDSHTGGRDLMGFYLGLRGFEVVSVEAGSPLSSIVDLCRDPDVTACCLSGVFAGAGVSAAVLGRMLEEAGIRKRLIFNAGGMAMSAEAASEAGCDVFFSSGAESADSIVSAVKNLKNIQSHTDQCFE